MRYDIESIEKRKNTERILRRFVDILLTIVIYNIVLVTISAMNNIEQISFFKHKAYIITTNSMEPSINAGDVIVVKEVNEEDLKVKDVITFKKCESKITHRISSIVKRDNKNVFITKGDNNNVEDTEGVIYENVLGKQVLRIPYIGKIISALNNQIVFLVFIFILLILYFLKIVTEERKENRREKKI
ncbi:MAG: signal peptidase I, partial [Clostridia bacterium]|nr:signal peptidase I [Clostridia bacterium]